MDEAAYRQAYFVDPQPEPLFRFEGIRGVSLFFDAYEEAVAFYSSVLGPPNYVEGAGTRSWVIGDSWLTLFAATAGSPANAEVQLVVDSPEEVDRLHAAFLHAGATGQRPTDELMHKPVRFGAFTDPFGASVLITADLPESRS